MKKNRLIDLRHRLHKNAEISGQENNTADIIISYLTTLNPDKIVTELGTGNGIAAVFDSAVQGPTIMIRGELDALPIKEENDIEYISARSGVSHVCGHDGHMTILCGLAEKLSKYKQRYQGKAIVLFQPAEETAAGAKDLMSDEHFHQLEADFIIGFHNIPGFQLGTLLVKKDVFSVASQGLIIRLYGQTSHAGDPEKGKNPMNSLIKIVQSIQKISELYHSNYPQTFITIIHLKLGKVAFGTNPGEAILMATLRSSKDEVMEKMSSEIIRMVEQTMSNYDIDWCHEWVEIFPALVNSEENLADVIYAANELKLPVRELVNPFSWSEDFSYFQQKYPSVFFGIGSGIHQPALHHNSYDFPDDLIPIGLDLCFEIICQSSKRPKEWFK